MAQLHDIPKYGFGTAFEIDPESVSEQPPGTACAMYINREQDNRITASQFKSLINRAISLGCRHFDCAPLYGTQQLVGAALRDSMGAIPRQQFFITSKVPPNMMRQENIVRSVIRSIHELQCNYLDLLLIHAPFSTKYISDDLIYPTDEDGNLLLDEQENLLEDAWRKMAELKREGYTRYIGISNVNIEQLERLNSIYQVDVVQNEYHIYNQDREIFDHCEELDIHFEAYAAFGSPIKSRRDGKPCFTTDPVVRRVARCNRITIAQANIQWIHQQPLSYVVRCDNVEQLEENILAIDNIYLPLNDLIDLDSLNRNIRIYYFDEHKGLDRHREYPFKRPPLVQDPPKMTSTTAVLTSVAEWRAENALNYPRGTNGRAAGTSRGANCGVPRGRPYVSMSTNGARASFHYGPIKPDVLEPGNNTDNSVHNFGDTDDEEPPTYRQTMSNSTSATSTISSATIATISSSSSSSSSSSEDSKPNARATGTWPRAASDQNKPSDPNHDLYKRGDDAVTVKKETIDHREPQEAQQQRPDQKQSAPAVRESSDEPSQVVDEDTGKGKNIDEDNNNNNRNDDDDDATENKIKKDDVDDNKNKKDDDDNNANDSSREPDQRGANNN